MDLDIFIRSLGYESVLHEKGQVPYGSDKKLEVSCYSEIQLADIVVSIIGGRFGSTSQHQNPYSISQVELKTALDSGKQVFIFIERSVYAEYSTYLKNKELEGLKFSFVDNVQVYQFIEEIMALPQNNAISSFEGVSEIYSYLREQWAGLFQRYLQEKERVREQNLIEDLQSTANTLQGLVTYFNKSEADKSAALQDLLLTAHPIFARLRALLRVGYRVFFTTKAELTTWLKVSRLYEAVGQDNWDDEDVAEWVKTDKGKQSLLKISDKLFDGDGRLKAMVPEYWDDSLVRIEVTDIEPSTDPQGE